MHSLNFSALQNILYLSFLVIQKVGTLMQEFIKKVTNMHKYKFFFFIRAAGQPARAYVGLLRAYGFTILARPAFFSRAYGLARRTRLILSSLIDSLIASIIIDLTNNKFH